MFARVGLRNMDFLKYSGDIVKDGRNRPLCASMRFSGFPGHPCPEISVHRAEY